ncbi:MAG: efflux RND transporter periplasmic adaptor subunit [Pseudomonadota bacterium]
MLLRALIIGLCLTSPVLAQGVTAVLEPARTVELRSTVNGRIAALDLRDGALVAQGDVLAKIDAAVQEARVQLAEVVSGGTGALVRAEQLLTQAQTRLDRVTEARSKGAAQEWEVVAAQQLVDIAAADLQVVQDDHARREAELALERATLSEFQIVAPFDATVLEVFVDAGEIVDTATPFMEIGNIDTLSATAFLPVDWLPGLERGGALEAITEFGDRVSVGIDAIDPRVDPASRTVRVVLTLDNGDGRLLPGTTLEIEGPA